MMYIDSEDHLYFIFYSTHMGSKEKIQVAINKRTDILFSRGSVCR